eukprot:TRINITY_DN8618_c0_g1_i2.p1 TRINITY_DN8618_c0_g1~~TRINITY_DN8618_c0_g1_i2.p1  ORF type:complete len:431 (-),score=61.49 TRINITY_DN8618_c0_g1_i2:13-1305(-)
MLSYLQRVAPCAIWTPRTRIQQVLCSMWLGRSTSSSKSKSDITVAVAMSGGVDSTVSALLLKNEGYNVKGVYMNNWDEKEEHGACQGELHQKDARSMAEQLNIEFHVVSFMKEYWNYVFEPTLQAYQHGLTPNPDIMCNREIKFTRLLSYVKDDLKADYLATGHYVRKQWNPNTHAFQLLTAKDMKKDQSYFLLAIPQNALQHLIFPVGDLLKTEVREIAANANLRVATKKDSYGLCFVGKRNWSTFVNNYLPSVEGDIIDYRSNRVLGKHKGVHLYTIGQRARIAGALSPHYVVKINGSSIFVDSKRSSLYCDQAVLKNMNWIEGILPETLRQTKTMRFRYKARHEQNLHNCTLSIAHAPAWFRRPPEEFEMLVTFDHPQCAVTRGQYLGLYDEHTGVCYGGGEIAQEGPSYYDQGLPLPSILYPAGAS